MKEAEAIKKFLITLAEAKRRSSREEEERNRRSESGGGAESEL